jgi:ankyrin repeat protein
VQLLIDNGADVNAQGGRTGYSNALHTALARGQREIIQLLVDKGAEVKSEHYANELKAFLARASISPS